MFLPSSRICPLVCFTSPQRICASVVFPAPFCPVIAVILPLGKDSETSSKIVSLRIFFEIPAAFKTDGLSSGTEGRETCFLLCGARRPMRSISASGRRSKSFGAYARSIFPSRRYKNRSAISMSQPIRCSAMSRVYPCAFNSFSVRASCLVPAASRLAVGSSHTRTFGFIAYTEAIAVRCFSPLEMASSGLSLK